MLLAIRRAASLTRASLSRSLPAFSTSSVHHQECADQNEGDKKEEPQPKDPICLNEAPKIDNEVILENPEVAMRNATLECSIAVPCKVDLSPVNGVPPEHIYTRRVRIYQPAKNAMQSGTNNIHHWEMEFDTRQRWENPLMGWTSTGDPLSNLKVQFRNPDEAIELCEKNGWCWYIDTPKIEKQVKPKNYGLNFHWNRRTRVSTK